MRGTIGLLLYVAVMVLASVLKKMAGDKAKQEQGSTPVAVDGDSYTVTIEDILLESIPLGESEVFTNARGVEPASDTNVGESSIQEMGEFDHWDEWESEEQETEGFAEEGESIDDSMKAPQHLSWEQAIIFSEIIREPRAKRAWPSR